MRRRYCLFVVLAAYGMTLGLSSWQSRCFASLLHAEFVQPPAIFAHHTSTMRYCGPTVVKSAPGQLVIPSWKFQSVDGGRTWTPMETDSWRSNNVIRLRDGRWAALDFLPSQMGQGSTPPAIRFSTNNGQSWSTDVRIAHQDGIYYVPNERLMETSRNELIVPAGRGSGQYEGDNNSAGCFYSTDGGATWSLSETWAQRTGLRGMAEPNVVELADGRLYMLARTDAGVHYRSYSTDGGRTWLTPQPTTLKAACSPLTMKKMPDGRLIVVYDDAEKLDGPGSLFPRSRLVFSISADQGTTWSASRIIDEGLYEYAYPSITFLDEGILVVYSSYGSGSKSWKVGGGASCILRYPPPASEALRKGH
jgi:sialidase-1